PSNFEVGSSRYPQFSPCSICAVCCKGGVSGTSDNEAIFHTSSILPTSFGPHLILPVSGRSTMVLTGFFLLSIRQYYPILSKESSPPYQDDRMDHELQLVDEVMLQQHVHQLTATIDQNVLTWLLFQLLDLLHDIRFYQVRIVPVEFLRSR